MSQSRRIHMYLTALVAAVHVGASGAAEPKPANPPVPYCSRSGVHVGPSGAAGSDEPKPADPPVPYCSRSGVHVGPSGAVGFCAHRISCVFPYFRQHYIHINNTVLLWLFGCYLHPLCIATCSAARFLVLFAHIAPAEPPFFVLFAHIAPAVLDSWCYLHTSHSRALLCAEKHSCSVPMARS